MHTIFDGKYDYPDMNYNFFNFNKFFDDNKNLLYVYGIFADELPTGYKNRIYFNIEEPNGLYHSGKLLHERELNNRVLSYDWTKILQICPYSTKWLRESLGDSRYEFVKNVPVCNDEYFPKPEEKIYDLFYQGSIHGCRREFSACIDAMTKFKYVWTSLSDEPDTRKTHIKVPFLQKLKLESQCKITVVDNLLYDPHPGAFATNIRRLPNWQQNEAFSHIDAGIMPQFKVKLLESMMCRVLILAQKLPWNIMEDFGFVEGEHFLYFEEPYELEQLIKECLSNWDYCQTITENAYNKAINENSITSFYNTYLKSYDN